MTAPLYAVFVRIKGGRRGTHFLPGALGPDEGDGFPDPARPESFRRIRAAGVRIQYQLSLRGDRKDSRTVWR